jgi:hypothetical protein
MTSRRASSHLAGAHLSSIPHLAPPRASRPRRGLGPDRHSEAELAGRASPVAEAMTPKPGNHLIVVNDQRPVSGEWTSSSTPSAPRRRASWNASSVFSRT